LPPPNPKTDNCPNVHSRWSAVCTVLLTARRPDGESADIRA
jgi:hypothetical protein